MWASLLSKMQQELALPQSHCLCGVLWGGSLWVGVGEQPKELDPLQQWQWN